VERLTRGCDGGCGLAAARANLDHPCVRFLVLEHFASDLARLQQALAPAQPFAESMVGLLEREAKHQRRNANPFLPRTAAQVKDPLLMARLAALLEEDTAVYRHALEIREAKWAQPLASCT